MDDNLSCQDFSKGALEKFQKKWKNICEKCYKQPQLQGALSDAQNVDACERSRRARAVTRAHDFWDFGILDFLKFCNFGFLKFCKF